MSPKFILILPVLYLLLAAGCRQKEKAGEYDPNLSLAGINTDRFANYTREDYRYYIDSIKTANTADVSIIYNDENIQYVSEFFGTRPPITRLELVGLNTTKFPGNLSKLDSLQELSIRANRPLTYLPADVFELERLTALSMTVSGLKSVPRSIRKLTRLKYLNLSYSDFTSIPEGIDKCTNLTYISIAGTYIQKLPASLNQLTGLTMLDVSSCPITESAYTNVNRLKTLIANYKAGWQPVTRHLNDTAYLETLELTGNDISAIPDNILHLPALSTLMLDNNQLNEKSKLDFSALQNLTTLMLSSNKLTDEAAAHIKFPARPVIRELGLSGNKLETLDSAILNEQTLEHLSVGSNQLKRIPAAISGLKRLKHLDVGLNKIVSLPSTLQELRALETLDVSGNETLNSSINHIFDITSLKDLNISHNNYISLPARIANLQQLEKLEASYNKFETLPDTLASLKMLKNISLDYNNFSSIPSCIARMSQLEQFSIITNNIDSLNIPLDSLQQLSSLQLSHNKLRHLPKQLADLSRLAVLEISDNPLLDPYEDLKLISGINTLHTLVAANCNISRLPPEIQALDSLATLQISNNKLDMDETRALLSKMKPMNLLFIDNNTPPPNRHFSWFRIAYLAKGLALITGVFLLYYSLLLYRKEQGNIENKLSAFWLFLSEENTERKGVFRWVYSFQTASKLLFDKLFTLRFGSLQTWGVITAFNAAFLGFYLLTSFRANSSVKNDFTNPLYLFVAAFLALAFTPLCTKRTGKYILPVTLVLVGVFLKCYDNDTKFLFHYTFLLASSVLTFGYFKALYNFMFMTGRSFFLTLLALLFHVAIVSFLVFSIRHLVYHAALSGSKMMMLLFYFSLTLNTLFFVSVFCFLSCLILVLHHLLERFTYFIIDQKVLTNRKIAIPLGVALIGASAVPGDKFITALEKLLKLIV